MTEQELLQEQEQIKASIETWQRTVAQCDTIIADVQGKRSNALRQCDVHSGHLERINIWLGRIDYAKSDNT